MTYWEGGVHWGFSYLTGRRRECSPAVLAILEAANHWSDREELPAPGGEDADDLVDGLIDCGFLDAADRPSHPHERAMAAWDSWNPATGFFHRATRFTSPASAEDMAARAERLIVERDFPSPLKEYPGAARVRLTSFERDGELADALGRRRTWRKFGERPVTLAEISTLLGLTFGVRQWMHLSPNRRVPLKSSPSGGARHSIEAYLVAPRVEGLDAGTYHYCPDTHTLARLPAPLPADFLAQVMPTQPAFHRVNAFIVMTSVFARVQWKYPSGHAYRVIHLDAGHLSQTFALVATAMNLAPFCTAAVDMPVLERHFDIDGVSEGVIHALGVGTRPDDVDWAPVHDASETPHLTPPAWSST